MGWEERRKDVRESGKDSEGEAEFKDEVEDKAEEDKAEEDEGSEGS